MPALRTSLTELTGARRPVQQAGFGGVVPSDLVVSVANAGGIGTVGATLLDAGALGSILDDIDGRTGGVVAANFIPTFFDPEEHGEALDLAARRTRIVEFFYEWPDRELVKRAGAEGALVSWQVGSAEEAEQAVEAGCDLITAQAIEAGGHVRGRVALLPLLAETLPRVDVPVIAAGGIATAAAMAGAMATGAGGVRVGTRMVASAESPFHHDYIQALLAAKAEDSVYTDRFSEFWPNAPHRVLAGSIDRAAASEEPLVGEMELAGDTIPVQRWAGMAPTNATSGEIDAMAQFAGQGVGSIKDVRPAGEIVAELSDGAADLLAGWHREGEVVERANPT